MQWVHNPAYDEAPFERIFVDDNGEEVKFNLPNPRYDKDMHPVLAYILVDQ